MASGEKTVFKDIYSKMASNEKMVLKDTYSKMAGREKIVHDKQFGEMTVSQLKLCKKIYSYIIRNKVKAARGIILDQPVPEINVPTLIPSKFSSSIKKSLTTLKNKINNEISDFVNSIPSFKEQKKNKIVSDQVKKLKTTVKNIFRTVYKDVDFSKYKRLTLNETESALSGFTKTYEILNTSVSANDEYKEGDEKVFLNNCKPLVTNFFKKNRQIKVRLDLKKYRW